MAALIACACLFVSFACRSGESGGRDRVPVFADGQTIGFGGPEVEPFLGRGWGKAEGTYRWTVGSRAEMSFRRSGSARLLDLTLHPFVPGQGTTTQHVHVDVNGELTSALAIQDPDPRRYVVLLGGAREDEITVLGMALPDARTPHSVDGKGDLRPLAVAVHTASLRRFPDLPMGRTIAWGLAEAEPYLAGGWSTGEGATRWNDGVTASIVFATAPGDAGATLVFDWQPFFTGDATPQRVRVTVNDERIGEFTLEGPARRRTPVVIPPSALRAENVVTLAFPHARSPASLRHSNDQRLLAVKVHAVSLARTTAPASPRP